MSIWVRNFFTMAVSRDLYEGVPAIYVNYLGYDETAHRTVRAATVPCRSCTKWINRSNSCGPS